MAFLTSTFLPSGGFAERPGAVKGAFCAAQRTLDGEDRSATIPLGRKVGRPDLELASDRRCSPKPLFALLLSPPFHPHSLMSDSSLGASWVFSFQPVLPPVCRPLVPSHDGRGQALDAVTGTRRLDFGLVALCFFSAGIETKRLSPTRLVGGCAAVRKLLH